MHWISVFLGLVFAWAILFFIGKKPRVVSYYKPEVITEEPVVDVAMSELDAMMMAVGLISESTLEMEAMSLAPSPAPAPAPMMDSVAEMAMSQVPDMDNEVSSVMPPAPSTMIQTDLSMAMSSSAPSTMMEMVTSQAQSSMAMSQ